MAHLNLHLAEGLAIGTALTILPLARDWLTGRPVARALGRMAIVSLGLAAWAAAPAILTRLGAPSHIHRAAWANIFLGHAAIARRIRGGLLIGEVAIAAWLVALYLLLLLAIRRARGSGTRAAGTPAGSRTADR